MKSSSMYRIPDKTKAKTELADALGRTIAARSPAASRTGRLAGYVAAGGAPKCAAAAARPAVSAW